MDYKKCIRTGMIKQTTNIVEIEVVLHLNQKEKFS